MNSALAATLNRDRRDCLRTAATTRTILVSKLLEHLGLTRSNAGAWDSSHGDGFAQTGVQKHQSPALRAATGWAREVRADPISRSAPATRQANEFVRMALSARNRQLLPTEPVLRSLEEPDQGSCEIARNLGIGTAYNQQAFRYFLAHERRRSERSNRPFLLLLVDFQQQQLNGHLEPSLTAKLFAGLSEGLRDTDVIGWYHEGRVAGAVLTHVEDASSTDVSGEIRGRLTNLLTASLPRAIAVRLQVRVYQLPAGLPQ
jgi:hypothetical protein